MSRFFKLIFLIVCFGINSIHGQDIELFEQFNGRFDYTAIGNTLNPAENNLDQSFCETLPSASADLNLNTDFTVVKAILYWAGSGTGDTEVTLNSETITAESTYTVDFQTGNNTLTYFSCFADITNQIINEGNTNYLFSNLDISETLTNNPGYCSNRTNFAGWSIHVIYEDLSLPINQVNIFQGLEIINTNVQEKTIELNNLNVIDTIGAKIGFLAWEGDNSLNFGESLSLNDEVLSNPPLNLAENAFNGTNTFTNSNDFYNADLDVYNIENNIAIGDTSATIKLTTGETINGQVIADLIILNTIVTVLNSQLPDATINLEPINTICASPTLDILYTVNNFNATEVLPANTPISFYINDQIIATTATEEILAINDSETNTITLNLPESLSGEIVLLAIVDDDGTGNGVVLEISETNNTDLITFTIEPLPEAEILNTLISCDIGFNSAEFDLTQNLQNIIFNDLSQVSFYESLDDLTLGNNEIINPENYTNSSNPQIIFIKVENTICFDLYSFQVIVENCPPTIPEGFSPNDDGKNDWFNIQGLYDIFENHELLIYSRYGNLIFEGNNTKRWDGKANRGLPTQDKLVPTGTYFYVLNLKDSAYKPITGWVYLNR